MNVHCQNCGEQFVGAANTAVTCPKCSTFFITPGESASMEGMADNLFGGVAATVDDPFAGQQTMPSAVGGDSLPFASVEEFEFESAMPESTQLYAAVGLHPSAPPEELLHQAMPNASLEVDFSEPSGLELGGGDLTGVVQPAADVLDLGDSLFSDTSLPIAPLATESPLSASSQTSASTLSETQKAADLDAEQALSDLDKISQDFLEDGNQVNKKEKPALLISLLFAAILLGVIGQGVLYQIEGGRGIHVALDTVAESVTGTHINSVSAFPYPAGPNKMHLVLRGTAQGTFPQARKDLYVAVKLLSSRGKTVATARAPLGLALSAGDFKSIVTEQDAQQLYGKKYASQYPLEGIKSGSGIPFTVVVTSLPRGNPLSLRQSIVIELGEPMGKPLKNKKQSKKRGAKDKEVKPLGETTEGSAAGLGTTSGSLTEKKGKTIVKGRKKRKKAKKSRRNRRKKRHGKKKRRP